RELRCARRQQSPQTVPDAEIPVLQHVRSVLLLPYRVHPVMPRQHCGTAMRAGRVLDDEPAELLRCPARIVVGYAPVFAAPHRHGAIASATPASTASAAPKTEKTVGSLAVIKNITMPTVTRANAPRMRGSKCRPGRWRSTMSHQVSPTPTNTARPGRMTLRSS